MNEHQKNEWGNLKKEVREFKDSLSHVLWVLFIVFSFGVSAWMIWEFIKILIIDNLAEVFQTTLGIIFWIVIAMVVIFLKKDWWDKRQEKKIREKINADLRQKRDGGDTPKEENKELQVVFFRKNPEYPKPKDHKENE